MTSPDHSRMKPVELEGLTLSQLSALSLLEISSSELEPGEPTSASSHFLLRPALAIASIWPWFAWRAGHRSSGRAHRGPAEKARSCNGVSVKAGYHSG